MDKCDTAETFDPALLKVGDCLLYRPESLMGWLIALKTWHRVSHVEIYSGALESVASRDGEGVNEYEFRWNGLTRVMRPRAAFAFGAAMQWFATVVGQDYDWKGLLCFYLAVRQGAKDRMFCSEFATRFYRAGGLEPFQPDTDADHVAPGQYADNPAFETIWSDHVDS